MFWEQIQVNKRKSIFLFTGMGVLLLLSGYIYGSAYIPETGGAGGVVLALLVWSFLSMISFFAGDKIFLKVSKAKKVDKSVHPQLFNIVEEMVIAANMPHMPDIYIIESPALNAFATGRKPENASIAVTAGLLAKLNRDELQGVIAHEMSHIMNRDILFMTFAGIFLGSIVLVSEVFLRSMFYSSMTRRYRSSSRNDSSQAQLVLMVFAILLAILAPLFAQLLYFALSRKREYLADASAVRLTRYPDGLANALEKISNSTADLATANKVTAAAYIANPLKKKGRKLNNLSSTHPPITERIKILKSMKHGAGLKDYESAFSNVAGGTVLPRATLNSSETVALRKKNEKAAAVKNTMRATTDIIRAVNNYIFLTCACGIKIKIPPGFKYKKVICPRCSRENTVPSS